MEVCKLYNKPHRTGRYTVAGGDLAYIHIYIYIYISMVHTHILPLWMLLHSGKSFWSKVTALARHREFALRIPRKCLRIVTEPDGKSVFGSAGTWEHTAPSSVLAFNSDLFT